MEKMRVCFIGCGSFARNFVPLFKAHPVVEKVFVCDLVPQRAAEYAKLFEVEIIESLNEVLRRDDINAVAIFAERHRHGPIAIAALKAGKHVYSAVPCASTVEEIFEIEELVRKTRLTYSMGETGYYRAPTVFCRQKYKAGEFGDFVYGEAQYNHDQRHFDFTRSGPDWRKVAGVPPMLYPTHSTAMILGAMRGVYIKKVSALGWVDKKYPEIFGTDGQNLWDNPFTNTAMLAQLSNGGVARISENRCVAFGGPNTYISQFYGSEAAYEFSMVHHYYNRFDPENPGKLITKDITSELQPTAISEFINDDDAAQRITNGFGFTSTSPIQPTHRLPKEFEGQKNGHNGTHQFLIDDFCRAYETGKLSPTNIWQVARFNLPGLIAHQSALRGGEMMNVPDLGDPPADWEVLDLD